MAAIQDVMHTISPRLAILPDYDGQEPPHTYYAKLRAINETARPLGVAAFNAAERANVMKSKMTGKIFPVPAQNPYNANANIVTEAEVYNWMQGKYRETMIGNQQASLKALMNERFTSLDTIDTYEKRIRPYVLGIVDAEVLPYLYDHLPPRLETRIRIANPNTVNDFFTQLRIIWLESGGPTSNFGNEINSGSSAMYDWDIQVIYQTPQQYINFLKTTLQKIMEDNLIILRKNLLDKIVIPELLKKYIRQRNHRKLLTNAQIAEKLDIEKMCPGLVKKSKKVNNVYQSEPENLDDEEIINASKPLNNSIACDKDTKLHSLNHAIKVYQGAQIRQNWPNPFEVDFLDIKEPNDVATISCRIGDLIIPHAILDTGADDSLYTDNIPEYLGIKIDKKNVHKLMGAVGDSQSIGTSYNVPISIDSEKDSITVSEKEISVIPTKKDRDGKDTSTMILGTKWQPRVGWDPIVKGEFTATHNEKTITIPLSTHKESRNAFNTERLQASEVKKKMCKL
ncbi:4051_t:CDS:2 [Acaulospora colombiana]|uniref:4051_t:CDS:1 n=1 Tax=Acaulospora colombiana TaxID=27376 RepID=A0ACA9L765_9GLOM|nr:4051_t:CDS:2 [Acaulospora colombiana]